MFSKRLMAEYIKGRDANRLGDEWGLGRHIQKTPEGTIVGQSSFMPGYIANMWYYVKDCYAVC